jgi:hypothetical protein
MAEGANVGTKYLLSLNSLTGRERLGVVKEPPYSLKVLSDSRKPNEPQAQ